MKLKFNQKNIKGMGLVLFANIIWGTSAFIVKFFPDIDSISIVWSRTFFASIFLVFWLLVSFRSVKQFILKKDQIKDLLLLATTFIGTVGFMTAGAKYGTVTSTIFLLYTAPIFVVVLSKYLLKEKTKKGDDLSLILASLGLFFIFSGSLSSKLVIGDVFGLMAGISWGLQIILTKRIGSKIPTLIANFWTTFFALVILTPFANIKIVFGNQIIPLIIYGVTNNAIAGLAFYEGLKHIDTKKAGFISLIDPIENSLLALLFFKEVPALGAFLGAVMIIMSVIVSSLEIGKKKN